MKIIAISEHFFPRVGGTVNYVHETLSALSAQGVEVELWVPGPIPEDPYPKGLPDPRYRVVWIEAGYPNRGDPSRQQRYEFCKLVDHRARQLAVGADKPDLIHVMFGLFVMEVLATQTLKMQGVPSVATVHNLPPHECRLVLPSASLVSRWRENVRLALVGLKNASRLRKHAYDSYVVPSEQVRSLLKSVLPKQPIEAIGHGPTGGLMDLMHLPDQRVPNPGEGVRLLTAGGFAPHKQQHLIPAIADRLRGEGIDFEWDVVGPAGRVSGYQKSIIDEIDRRDLSERVRVSDAVPVPYLAQLYDRANLYVQPSIEEGFCITALDAAAAGLPVIASPAGALAMIAELSGGALVRGQTEPIAAEVISFIRDQRWLDSIERSKLVQKECSWQAAAAKLLQIYRNLINRGDTAFV